MRRGAVSIMLTSREQFTGSLYSDCFRAFNKTQWLAQGQLLAQQLGLDSRSVAGKTVLDGGCGHGALVYTFARMGAKKVTGIDLEPSVPADVFIDAGNARFVKGSLLNLPFADNSFDLVASSGVLHHTEDPEKGFSELARVLRPGGRLVLGVYGKYGLFPWTLYLARLVTAVVPLIPYGLTRWLCGVLRLNPIWRYQVLDYLYVPILRRYTPVQALAMFKRYGITDVARVSNLTQEKAKEYIKANASYTYDHRALSSKILFGHGFIVVAGVKSGQ